MSTSEGKTKIKEYVLEMKLWEKINGGSRLIKRVATPFNSDSDLDDSFDDSGVGNLNRDGNNPLAEEEENESSNK